MKAVCDKLEIMVMYYMQNSHTATAKVQFKKLKAFSVIAQLFNFILILTILAMVHLTRFLDHAA